MIHVIYSLQESPLRKQPDVLLRDLYMPQLWDSFGSDRKAYYVLETVVRSSAVHIAYSEPPPPLDCLSLQMFRDARILQNGNMLDHRHPFLQYLPSAREQEQHRDLKDVIFS